MSSKSSSLVKTSNRGPQQYVVQGGGKANPKPKKIKPETMYLVDFATHPHLKDAFVVLLAGTLGITQYTVHHPIGATPLADEEWIVTPTSDIHFLLERIDDPQKREKAAAVQQQRLSSAVKKGYLNLIDGVVTYSSSGRVRNDVLAQARDSRGEAKSPLFNFIENEDDRKTEENLEYFWASPEITASLKKIQGDYVTLGGPLADQPQRPNRVLKGLSGGQARDRLTKSIFGYGEESDEFHPGSTQSVGSGILNNTDAPTSVQPMATQGVSASVKVKPKTGSVGKQLTDS